MGLRGELYPIPGGRFVVGSRYALAEVQVMFGKQTQIAGEVHKLGKRTPLGKTPQGSHPLPRPYHNLPGHQTIARTWGSVVSRRCIH